MENGTITIELPVALYDKLQRLAKERQLNPIEVMDDLVSEVYQRRQWLQTLNQLRKSIQDTGGLQLGTTDEEIVAKLRQTRREIFEAEYAHLYRQ